MADQKDRKTQRIEVSEEIAKWLTSYSFAFSRQPVEVATEALEEYRTRKVGKTKGGTA